MINRLQIRCKFFLVLVSYIFERVPHHMYNAPLVFGHRKCCRYSVSDTGKAIRAEYKNVSYAANFQLIQHAEPEFCTFILSNCDGQNFLVSLLADTENHINSLLSYNAVVPDIEHDSVNVYDRVYST